MVEAKIIEMRATLKELSRPGGPRIFGGQVGFVKDVTNDHIARLKGWIAELTEIVEWRRT